MLILTSPCAMQTPARADVWSYPVDWTLAPRRPQGPRPTSPRPRFVVGFVFDIPDLRFLPEEFEIRKNVERVLRTCTTHVARVLYGRGGRPEMSCILRAEAAGEGVYVEERRAFGEGYWKEV